jgi:dual-specificity kinase
MFCGQEVGNLTSFAHSRAPSDNTTSSSLYERGVARIGSPPRRDDDKDGHYMFELGENLTSRCNFTLPSSKTFYVCYLIEFSH